MPFDYSDDSAPKVTKKTLRREIKTLRGILEQERASRTNAQDAEREANRRRAQAELQLRNLKAAVQMIVSFANDDPPPPGRFYIDPVNGEVSRVAVGSGEKATR